MDRVTAVIKTFERPHLVRQLVRSIRAYYPSLSIIVVDDSKEAQPVAGTVYVHTAFDIGLSAGRNIGLERVQTPYCLLLDDDMVFTHATRLELMLEALDAGLDIAGGRVDAEEYHGLLIRDGSELRYVRKASGLHANYPLYDIVWNFFMGRTDRVKQVGWDPMLKLSEHSDFFLRAKKIPLLITHLPGVDIDHDRDRYGKYQRFRGRSMYYAALFLQKHGITRSILYDGSERTVPFYLKVHDQQKKILANV